MSAPDKFLFDLEESIQFHRNNQNDPHNVGNAVILALEEVRNSFARAYADELQSAHPEIKP